MFSIVDNKGSDVDFICVFTKFLVWKKCFFLQTIFFD